MITFVYLPELHKRTIKGFMPHTVVREDVVSRRTDSVVHR